MQTPRKHAEENISATKSDKSTNIDLEYVLSVIDIDWRLSTSLIL